MKTKSFDSLVRRTKGQIAISDLIVELVGILTELEERQVEMGALAGQLPEVESRLRRLSGMIKAKTPSPFVDSILAP